MEAGRTAGVLTQALFSDMRHPGESTGTQGTHQGWQEVGVCPCPPGLPLPTLEDGECVRGALVFVWWSWPPLQSLWFIAGAGSAKGWPFPLSPERGGQRRTSHSRAVKVKTAPRPRYGHVTLLGVCIHVWGLLQAVAGGGGGGLP